MISFKNKGIFKQEKFSFIVTLNKTRLWVIASSVGVFSLLVFSLGFLLGNFSGAKLTEHQENAIKNTILVNENISKSSKKIENIDTSMEDDNSPVSFNDVNDPKNADKYTRIADKESKKKGNNYFIQLVSSKDRKRIDYYANELVKRKFRVFVKKTGDFYVLSTGVYNSKESAKEDLDTLINRGNFKDAFVKLGYVKR